LQGREGKSRLYKVISLKRCKEDEKYRKVLRKILLKIARDDMMEKRKRKVVENMAVISPVSDLRNYNTVLEKVAVGSPVYLTVNGRGRYTIRDIEEDEEFEKTKAMLPYV